MDNSTTPTSDANVRLKNTFMKELLQKTWLDKYVAGLIRGKAARLAQVVIDFAINLQNESKHLAEDVFGINALLLGEHRPPIFVGCGRFHVLVARERAVISALLHEFVEHDPVLIVLLLLQDSGPVNRAAGPIEFFRRERLQGRAGEIEFALFLNVSELLLLPLRCRCPSFPKTR